ncbi:unnamed protein product, partial [Didymodactylos carnosus]
GTHDLDEYDLSKHFEECITFIKEARENNKIILVHCSAGVSRSPTIIAAYLIKEFRWSTEKALIYIYKKRNCITPNKGFMKLLFQYQYALGIPNEEMLH